MPKTHPHSHPGRFPWIALGLVFLLLATLSIWSWQKWSGAWVERSEDFFPPEWKDSGSVETLAWRYPIYRSNDTYQWVRLADGLIHGDNAALRYRVDEGPPEGRPNAWHSGLARVLQIGGSLNARLNDWPEERGIRDLAHWFGAASLLCIALGGACLFWRAAGFWPAVLFPLLYFFNAAINWDFAYSRLDHEIVFQAFFLLQITGIWRILQARPHKKEGPRNPALAWWALLAGVGSGGCWWVGSTMEAAVGLLITLGCVASCKRATRPTEGAEAFIPAREEARAFMIWGFSAAALILAFAAVDGRLAPTKSIAGLHPLFILPQIGAGCVCAASRLPLRRGTAVLFSLGLLAGATPLIWLGFFGSDAHVWVNPLMRRMHDYIVEFQSPFANGLWRQGETVQALLATVAALALLNWKRPEARFAAVLLGGLLILSLLQTRWLGLLATTATVILCFSIQASRIRRIAVGALLLCLLTNWTWKWNRIEHDPGRAFVVDMFLQVGARDVNLNLDHYAAQKPAPVALPYAFAATSALFEKVRPLGTFYWENQAGIAESASLFAAQDDTTAQRIAASNDVAYIIVQAGGQGRPFAEMVSWIARGTRQAETIDASLAWRLSTGTNVPEWCKPLPFYGTFPPERIALRIYRVVR